MTEEPDQDLNDAIEACAKIVEEKCQKRPYMIILAKADLSFETEGDKIKKLLKGKASYLYTAKPAIKPDGVSKILIGASKKALELAESKARGKSSELDEKQGAKV